MSERSCGILLPVASLPSSHGIGDMGEAAYRFVDFLQSAGQRNWQILPLSPTDTGVGDSPYSSCSAFAGNVLLISLERMVEDGMLDKSDLPASYVSAVVDYEYAVSVKINVLRKSFSFYKDPLREDAAYDAFCQHAGFWLNDYAAYVALKKHYQYQSWNQWPDAVRFRKDLSILENEAADNLAFEKFVQYVFFKQWYALKEYAAEKDISIIGDIPIYVTYDSADVWAHPELFKLNKNGLPTVVAGVPPDYFSETGQLWGNPVYDWNKNKATGYDWWLLRMQHSLDLYDWVRIDHFRGLAAYWEVAAGEKTAMNGQWVPGPGEDFLKAIFARFSDPKIIAEDLGIITDDVKELMRAFALPGMRILMFAFGDDMQLNPYLPHNHIPNCVVYTGTHDNNTLHGWLRNEVSEEMKLNLETYLHTVIDEQEFHWQMMDVALASVADRVIFPMQDVLGLGADARMNTPGVAFGNWSWQVAKEYLSTETAQKLRSAVERHRRL